MSLSVVQQYHTINPKRLAVSPPKQINNGSKLAYGSYNGEGNLFLMTPQLEVCFLVDEHGSIKLGLPLADIPGSTTRLFIDALSGLEGKARMDIERSAIAWGVTPPVIFKASVQDAKNPRFGPTFKVSTTTTFSVLLAAMIVFNEREYFSVAIVLCFLLMAAPVRLVPATVKVTAVWAGTAILLFTVIQAVVSIM